MVLDTQIIWASEWVLWHKINDLCCRLILSFYVVLLSQHSEIPVDCPVFILVELTLLSFGEVDLQHQ